MIPTDNAHTAATNGSGSSPRAPLSLTLLNHLRQQPNRPRPSRTRLEMLVQLRWLPRSMR